MKNEKGFILIVVMGFTSVIFSIALAIVSLGCDELRQTKQLSNREAAYYVAMSGIDRMYSLLKSKEGQIVTWPQSVPAAYSSITTRAGGPTVAGTFSAAADTVQSNVFGITSTGTVNGRTSSITAKYGFSAYFTNGYPIGSVGSMSLEGSSWFVFKSWVRAEGPLASGGDVTTNNFVKISGTILENQPLEKPNFWMSYNPGTNNWTPKVQYDTNSDGNSLTDTTQKGYVNISDAAGDPVKEAIFTADDINHDGMINDKDAFVAYYTVELNKQNLNIGEGQSAYYNGTQNFSPTSIPSGTPIIFVNGDANILFSDTSWWGKNTNHTLVATGDINIVQPTNRNQQTLTLISYGDVNTGGVHAFSGIQGNMVVYANGNINGYYGGKTNGAFFAGENVNFDTVLAIPGLLNRDISRGSTDWANASALPLGLPPGYDRISSQFVIKNEKTGFTPVWQRE